jgi:hypothetical protein
VVARRNGWSSSVVRRRVPTDTIDNFGDWGEVPLLHLAHTGRLWVFLRLRMARTLDSGAASPDPLCTDPLIRHLTGDAVSTTMIGDWVRAEMPYITPRYINNEVPTKGSVVASVGDLRGWARISLASELSRLTSTVR